MKLTKEFKQDFLSFVGQAGSLLWVFCIYYSITYFFFDTLKCPSLINEPLLDFALYLMVGTFILVILISIGLDWYERLRRVKNYMFEKEYK